MPDVFEVLVAFLATAGLLLILWVIVGGLFKPYKQSLYLYCMCGDSGAVTPKQLTEEIQKVVWLREWSGCDVKLLIIEEELSLEAKEMVQIWLHDKKFTVEIHLAREGKKLTGFINSFDIATEETAEGE